jgi:hypothetical protein
MAYTIKRTNGLVIATIADSDAVSTSVNTNYSVALLGKHSPNYGEIFNTNFIRLLENSANPGAPGTPIVGQLWFDSTPSNLGLNVCITEASGSTPAKFNPIALLTRSATAPTIYGLGKLWHDTTTNQLRSYNGVGAWDPIGVTNLDSLTDVTISTPADGQILKYNSSTSTWVNGAAAPSGTTLPTSADGFLKNNGSGTLSWVSVNALSTDTIVPLGNISGATAINRTLGSIFTATATGNFTLSPTNVSAGQSFTLILTQGTGGNKIGTYPGTFKFASGYKTLSTTANAVDMLNVFYDGTTYYTTLTTGYTP